MTDIKDIRVFLELDREICTLRKIVCDIESYVESCEYLPEKLERDVDGTTETFNLAINQMAKTLQGMVQ